MPTQRTNRRARNPYSEPVERPTGPDSHVFDVASKVECFHHNADLGQLCFDVEGIADGHRAAGNCNSRALAAGYNGTINPLSLTRRPYEKRPEAPAE